MTASVINKLSVDGHKKATDIVIQSVRNPKPAISMKKIAGLLPAATLTGLTMANVRKSALKYQKNTTTVIAMRMDADGLTSTTKYVIMEPQPISTAMMKTADGMEAIAGVPMSANHGS